MASGHDEWFADESIWEDLYPFTFPESAFAVADEQVEKILRLTGIGGGKVLDLCCGPGRHAVALAKRGFAVTAVDRTAFLLEHARARAAHASLSVEFVLEDMRRFSRPASFDLIINFFTSFGYFDDPADDLRVLELVCENLRPGGVFVLEMVRRERLARAFQATTSRELPNGHVLCCVRDITTFCRGQSAHLSVEGSRRETSPLRSRLSGFDGEQFAGMDRCFGGLHQFLCPLDYCLAEADQVLESFRIDRGSCILAKGGVVHPMDPRHRVTSPWRWAEGQARCQGVRRRMRLPEARWKASVVYQVGLKLERGENQGRSAVVDEARESPQAG